MNCHRDNFAILVLMAVLLTLTACGVRPMDPYTAEMALNTPTQAQDIFCEACDQATLAAALLQEQNSADVWAAATAAVLRTNAQATLNAANATLNAVQTQAQNDVNIIAAQIAATAQIERANAQATLNAADATRSAALTQDTIRQSQTANLATSDAEALATQQHQDNLAAGTQTAVANHIATQTQSAIATSQWYADQERQREAERQGPVAFLWMWCFPTVFLLFTGLIIRGLWWWFRIRQANQFALEKSVERLPLPPIELAAYPPENVLPHFESDVVEDQYQQVSSDDEVQRWLGEVKDKLRSSDEKDEENEPYN